MSTIVVAVDGSDESRLALRRAVDEAALRHADLEVVHAYEHKPDLHPFAMPEDMSAEQIQRRREDLQREAVRVKKHAEEAFVESVGDIHRRGVKVATLVCEDRHPAPALVEQSKGADMLVVGSRGLGGFAGLILGSVTQDCLHHATCPVTVIRRIR